MANKANRNAYAKVFNVHDPHDELAWADEQMPWWVTTLKIIGFVAGTIGLTTFFYFFTILVFQLS